MPSCLTALLPSCLYACTISCKHCPSSLSAMYPSGPVWPEQLIRRQFSVQSTNHRGAGIQDRYHNILYNLRTRAILSHQTLHQCSIQQGAVLKLFSLSPAENVCVFSRVKDMSSVLCFPPPTPPSTLRRLRRGHWTRVYGGCCAVGHRSGGAGWEGGGGGG